MNFLDLEIAILNPAIKYFMGRLHFVNIKFTDNTIPLSGLIFKNAIDKQLYTDKYHSINIRFDFHDIRENDYAIIQVEKFLTTDHGLLENNFIVSLIRENYLNELIKFLKNLSKETINTPCGINIVSPCMKTHDHYQSGVRHDINTIYTPSSSSDIERLIEDLNELISFNTTHLVNSSFTMDL